jgi:superfamily I DNA and/or RNA helicase
MMPIPYLVCMGLIGRDRLIIAGDFRQLGPIAISRSHAAFEWLHKDAFELVGVACDLTQLPSHPALAMLNKQRRMHPNICDLVNRSFYGGKLETAIQGGKKGGADLPPLPGKSVVLVSLGPEDGSKVELTEAGSRCNQGSAKVVVKLAKRFVQSNQQMEVGLITPCRAQVSLIKRLLRDTNLPNSSRVRLKIGTVHAFQGSEADVIIWDLVDSEHHSIGKPYQGETGNRLANVAITRARTKLVLVGDRNVFLEGRGSNMVGAFRNILGLHFLPRLGNVILTREL